MNGNGVLTEIGWRGARQVPVEVGAVALLESCAEAEVAQFDVPARVQQQIVRLYVSATRNIYITAGLLQLQTKHHFSNDGSVLASVCVCPQNSKISRWIEL